MKETFLRKFKVLSSDSFYKNTFYLILSSATSIALGVTFWSIAARFYSSTQVGIASTLISSINLIVMFSMFGFNTTLIRFLPGLKDKSSLINSCYTVSGLSLMFFSLIFLLGLNVWIPKLDFVQKSLVYNIAFILIGLAWLFYTLYDSLFVQRRKSKYVFAKNLISGVVRNIPIFFLIFCGAFGILISWGLSVLVALIISYHIFTTKVEPNYNLTITIKMKEIKRVFTYSVLNYLVIIFEWTPILLLPLMITNILSPQMTAYYFISWSVVDKSLIPLSSGITSLFAEGSNREGDLNELLKKSIKFFSFSIPLATLLLLLCSDYILSLFGVEYIENGLSVFRLLVLSSIPHIFNEVYRTVKRIKKNMEKVVVVRAIGTFTILALSYLLMKQNGLVGVGYAILCGRAIMVPVSLGLEAKRYLPSLLGHLSKEVK